MHKHTVYEDDELYEYLKARAEIENMTIPKLIIALLERQMHKDKIKKEISML